MLNYCFALNFVFLPFSHRLISSPRTNGSLCNFGSVSFGLSSTALSHITMQLNSIYFILNLIFRLHRFLRSTDNRPQSCFPNASSGPKIFFACYSCIVRSFRFYFCSCSIVKFASHCIHLLACWYPTNVCVRAFS